MWFWILVIMIIMTTAVVIKRNTGPATWCLPHKMRHDKDFCESQVTRDNERLEKELLYQPIKPSEKALETDVLHDWPRLTQQPESDRMQELLDAAEDEVLSKPCKHGAEWHYYFGERLFGQRHIKRFATSRTCVYGCYERKSISGTWSYL